MRTIRNLRTEKKVKAGHRIPAILVSTTFAPILREQASSVAALAHLDQENMTILETRFDKPSGHIALVVGPIEIYLPLAGLIDVSEERTRLEKDLTEALGQIQRLEKLLASSFSEKAPVPVVQKEREKLVSLNETVDKLRIQLKTLED